MDLELHPLTNIARVSNLHMAVADGTFSLLTHYIKVRSTSTALSGSIFALAGTKQNPGISLLLGMRYLTSARAVVDICDESINIGGSGNGEPLTFIRSNAPT